MVILELSLKGFLEMNVDDNFLNFRSNITIQNCLLIVLEILNFIFTSLKEEEVMNFELAVRLKCIRNEYFYFRKLCTSSRCSSTHTCGLKSRKKVLKC